MEAKFMFHIADSNDIKNGKITDVYFPRTFEILKKKGINKEATAEVALKSFPADWNWGILAGIEEVVEVLKELPVEVEALDEGTIFYPFSRLWLLKVSI